MNECKYCGEDYSGGVFSDEIARIDHFLFECDEIPQSDWNWYNMSPMQRRTTKPPENVTDDELYSVKRTS